MRCYSLILFLVVVSLLHVPDATVAHIRRRKRREVVLERLQQGPHPAPQLDHLPNIVLPQFSKTQGLAPDCSVEPLFPAGEPVLINTTLNDGTERRFVIYVPKSFAKRKGHAALKLLFHGLRGDCAMFLNTTGFIPYAERDGYILASACGTPGLLGTGWNAGECCLVLDPSPPNDAAFAKHIIDVVSAGACVDRERVMSVGYSNGGMLTELLACHNPPIVRAVVSVSGALTLSPGGNEGIAECAKILRSDGSGCRTSVLKIHGTQDIFVPFDGSVIPNIPTVADDVEGWVDANGCAGIGTVTLRSGNYHNEVYNDCSSDRGVLHRFWCLVRRITQIGRGLRGGNKEDAGANASEGEGGKVENPSTRSCKNTIVEAVYAENGPHEWPNNENFSATNYIYEFGKRVFDSY